MKRHAFLVFVTALLGTSKGHGVIVHPPARGLVPGGTRDYCAHCLNGGGPTAVHPKGWHEYKPMGGGPKRGNFGICGDRAGSSAHMRGGLYSNPSSTPFSAVYPPGGIVDLTWYMNANHKGYLELYVCDIDRMPGDDISYEGFPDACYGPLRRSPHPSCESGRDEECGPIDSEYPGRFVFPCGTRNFGGNGKMAFHLPSVEIQNGVLHAYWLTANSCTNPDGFMQKYDFPGIWNGCASPVQNLPTCGPTNKPEEFWNCVDIQVTSDPSRAKKDYPRPPKKETPSSISKGTPVPRPGSAKGPALETSPHPGADNETSTDMEPSPSPKPKCKRKWRSCLRNEDCKTGPCKGLNLVCGSYFGSSYMCVEDGPNVQPTGCVLSWKPCTIADNPSGQTTDPCCPGYTCASFQGSSPMCVSA